MDSILLRYFSFLFNIMAPVMATPSVQKTPQNAFKSTGGGGVLDLRRVVVDSGSIPESTHQSMGKRNNSLQSHPKNLADKNKNASILFYQHLPQGCCLNPKGWCFLRHPRHHPFSRCNYTNSWVLLMGHSDG